MPYYIPDHLYERLLESAEGDRSLFLVGLHGFLEHWLRMTVGCPFEELQTRENLTSFGQLLNMAADMFRSSLRGVGVWPQLRADILSDRRWTDRVRHNFEPVPADVFDRAIKNFVTLSRILFILQPFKKAELIHERAIKNKESFQRELKLQLDHLQRSLEQKEQELQGKNRELEHYYKLKQEAEEQSKKIQDMVTTIETLKSHSKEEHQELRETRNKLSLEIKNAQAALDKKNKELESYKSYRDLVEAADQMGAFIRSRRRLKEVLLEPSEEQQKILSEAKFFSRDLLVKGPPGTGKSLVLLLGLARYIQEFDIEITASEQTIPLLAYNRSLHQFTDSLLHHLISDSQQLRKIHTATVHSFLLGHFHRAFPGKKSWYQFNNEYQDFRNLLVEAVKEFPEFTAEFIERELVELIWDRVLTREEYLTESRRGFLKPLQPSQRMKVWQIVEKVEEKLEALEGWPSPYCFKKLYETPLNPEHPLIFVDEIQDLGRAPLAILRRLSRSGLIMAGDAAQMIYKASSPFADERVFPDKPLVRTLTRCFRNTKPILKLAYQFMGRNEESLDLSAERDGLPTVLLTGSEQEIFTILVTQILLYVNSYGYDPTNILVTGMTKKEYPTVQMILEKHHKIPSALLDDQGFDFDLTPGVRFSSLQKCKGLNFPVVMVCLRSQPFQPLIPSASGEEEAEAERLELEKRLIYVGMTRAMERLIMIVNHQSPSPTLKAVISSFEAQESEISLPVSS